MKIFSLLFLSIFFYLATMSSCPQNSPPAGFGITVSNEKATTRSVMIITGKSFTPNTTATVTISNFPRRGDAISLTGNVDGSGNFTRREEFNFVTVGRDEEVGDIQVSARDNPTGFFDAKSVSSAPYLIRFP